MNTTVKQLAVHKLYKQNQCLKGVSELNFMIVHNKFTDKETFMKK